MLSEARGTPLVVHVSAANTHDSTTLREMVKSIPAVRSRRGPRRRKPDKFRADKGYDSAPTANGCARKRSCRASPAAASMIRHD